ncbi:hypothetical protein TRFO_23591 [Tritrichomonas foetus]|uniref:CKK domain-containing protein n=1 Tax=Tritrichomonas foetus TaxID=1144522 RepID=A0A1J4KFA1_9EUKA|nr:hypothetical protein TRFO_23591 [Tritrichomonas foetus]|eukprot:OHT08053.1 hypothetical protein TRFO_23591 [Tritrichomonas foetus]
MIDKTPFTICSEMSLAKSFLPNTKGTPERVIKVTISLNDQNSNDNSIRSNNDNSRSLTCSSNQFENNEKPKRPVLKISSTYVRESPIPRNLTQKSQKAKLVSEITQYEERIGQEEIRFHQSPNTRQLKPPSFKSSIEQSPNTTDNLPQKINSSFGKKEVPQNKNRFSRTPNSKFSEHSENNSNRTTPTPTQNNYSESTFRSSNLTYSTFETKNTTNSQTINSKSNSTDISRNTSFKQKQPTDRIRPNKKEETITDEEINMLIYGKSTINNHKQLSHTSQKTPSYQSKYTLEQEDNYIATKQDVPIIFRNQKPSKSAMKKNNEPYFTESEFGYNDQQEEKQKKTKISKKLVFRIPIVNDDLPIFHDDLQQNNNSNPPDSQNINPDDKVDDIISFPQNENLNQATKPEIQPFDVSLSVPSQFIINSQPTISNTENNSLRSQENIKNSIASTIILNQIDDEIPKIENNLNMNQEMVMNNSVDEYYPKEVIDRFEQRQELINEENQNRGNYRNFDYNYQNDRIDNSFNNYRPMNNIQPQQKQQPYQQQTPISTRQRTQLTIDSQMPLNIESTFTPVMKKAFRNNNSTFQIESSINESVKPQIEVKIERNNDRFTRNESDISNSVINNDNNNYYISKLDPEDEKILTFSIDDVVSQSEVEEEENDKEEEEEVHDDKNETEFNDQTQTVLVSPSKGGVSINYSPIKKSNEDIPQKDMSSLINVDVPKLSQPQNNENKCENFQAEELTVENSIGEVSKSINKREESKESKDENLWIFIPIDKKKVKKEVNIAQNFSKVVNISRKYVKSGEPFRSLSMLLTKHKFEHLIMSIEKGSQALIGIYSLNNRMTQIRKIWGDGPEKAGVSNIETSLTYNQSSKKFVDTKNAAFNQEIDAIYLK